MSDRIVRYLLKIEKHGDTDAAVAQLRKDMKAAFEDTAKTRIKASKTAADREIKDAQRAAEQEEKSRLKVLSAVRKEREKMAREQSRLQERAAKETERAAKREEAAIKRLGAEYERLKAQQQTAKMQMTEGWTSATESVTRFGRGFAMLGLLGEENTEKLLKGMIKIQAGFDIIVGGVNAFVRLQKAMRGYQAAVEAGSHMETVARTKALAEINAEIAAETRLTAARTASAQAGVASSMARVGGGVAGGVGGAAGGGALTASILALPTAIAAAIAGVMAGGAMALNIGGSRDTVAGKMQASGALDPGTTLGNALASIGGLASRGMPSGNAQIIKQRERLQKLQDELFAKQYREQQKEVIGITGRSARMEAVIGARSQRMFATPQDRLRQLAADKRGLAQWEQQFAQPAESEEAEKVRQNALQLIKKTEADIAKERLAAQQEILGKRRQENEEAIQTAKEEKKLAEDRIKTLTEARQSLAERFGRMSSAEQARALAIGRKAAEYGVDALSRHERDIYEQVGGSRARERAEAYYRKKGMAAGYFDVYGGGEAADLERERANKSNAEAELQRQTQIKGRIEAEAKRIIEVTAAEVNDILVEIMRDTQAAILQEMRRAQNQAGLKKTEDIIAETKAGIE